MPDSKNSKKDIKEILRVLIGGIRPEIRQAAKKLVELLPEKARIPAIGRLVGALAQIVEKQNIFGIQEILSDAIEIVSDEIGKQVDKKTKDELQKHKKTLEEALEEVNKKARERLEKAQNVEEEKNRILEELKALDEILEEMKKIEKKYVPEEKKKEKKIDWDKIFQKINEGYQEINRKAESWAERINKWPRPF